MKALLLLCLVTSVAKANHPHHHHHMSHSTGSGQFVHSLAYKLPGAASFFRIKQVFPRYGHILNSYMLVSARIIARIRDFFLQKHKGFVLLFLTSLDQDA